MSYNVLAQKVLIIFIMIVISNIPDEGPLGWHDVQYMIMIIKFQIKFSIINL